jgi:hypothetical protein
MQANRIDNLLKKVGQLWMASIEKNIIKIVEKQKALIAQLLKRAATSRVGCGLSFEEIKSLKATRHFGG